MSPGPDFVMVAKNSISISRKAGLYTSIGLGFGISIHVLYSLIGIGLIISKSILLYSIIKYLGAAYLLYIGIKALRAQKSDILIETHGAQDITPLKAIRIGFLTNVLNPKATLFFLSLFTLVINPETSIGIQILYGLEMCLMTTIWFSLVSLFLSQDKVKRQFLRIGHYFERVMGGILIALGIKVALSTHE